MPPRCQWQTWRSSFRQRLRLPRKSIAVCAHPCTRVSKKVETWWALAVNALFKWTTNFRNNWTDMQKLQNDGSRTSYILKTISDDIGRKSVPVSAMDEHPGTSRISSSQPFMLLLVVVVYVLQSANLNRPTVPRCRLSTYGCRAFCYAGPAVWNSLPDELRNSDSFDSFKRFLKTTLFSRY